MVDHVIRRRVCDHDIRIEASHQLDDAAQVFGVGEYLDVHQADASVPRAQIICGGLSFGLADARDFLVCARGGAAIASGHSYDSELPAYRFETEERSADEYLGVVRMSHCSQ